MSTTNKFLDLSGIVGDPAHAAALQCTLLPRATYEPRAVDLRTPSGLQIGIGKAGQIYSIWAPGLTEDLIPKQREDAFFVDEVFQTVATNIAERQASSRGRAGTDEDRRGPGWHYHQAGAYQRGPLKGRPPVFSPVVYNRIDEEQGFYETLNLALQAHPNPKGQGDRFLVFMRLQHLGNDVFELSQGWINNSRNRNSATGASTTDLDHFNFPWFVVNQSAVPSVVAGAGNRIEDLSDRVWPPDGSETVHGARWLGAFRGGGDDAQGFALTFAADGRTRLRVGRTEKRVVLNVTDDRSRFEYGPEGIFVIGAVRTTDTVARGQGIIARSYLLFGPRSQLLREINAVAAKSFVRKIQTAGSPSPDDVVRICGAAGKQFDSCGTESTSAVFGLTREACTECLPLYELKTRTGYAYSTDPFLYAGGSSADLNASVTRILGWLYRKGAMPPRGYTAKVLTRNNEEGIHLDPSDDGEYLLLKWGR